MKNAYPSYQEFHMHQPFFSFDVKQYEEQGTDHALYRTVLSVLHA